MKSGMETKEKGWKGQEDECIRRGWLGMRRIDQVVIGGVDGSCYKKLSTGKYACIVCPHNPILYSPLMLLLTRNPLENWRLQMSNLVHVGSSPVLVDLVCKIECWLCYTILNNPS